MFPHPGRRERKRSEPVVFKSNVKEEHEFIIDSDTKKGATAVNSIGSEFSINMPEGVGIPTGATNVNVIVPSATIWWTIPNITTGVNDRLTLTVPNAANVLTPYVVTVQQGLYTADTLDAEIQNQLALLGAKISPKPTVQLRANSATQKIELLINYTGSSIDFTAAQNFREILGFDSKVVGPTVSDDVFVIADSVAGFNQIEYFLLHSDLVTRGIRVNANYSSVIAKILVTAAPGNQIVYQPNQPSLVEANHLAGDRRTRLKFWLTDDQNRLVNTAGETFSASIRIQYTLPPTKAEHL